jgi:hypothetical protein
MKMKQALLAIALATLTSHAAAQEVGEISVGVGVTSFGLSLEGEYALSPQASVRGLIMGGVSINAEFETDDAVVDGTSSFGGLAVLGDYYPMANVWRVSGGVFVSNTDISGTVTSGTETFDGSIVLANAVAPMLTTGFSAAITEGWALSGDFGLIFSSLEASGEDLDPDQQAELDNINASLADIPVVPFIGFAVSYAY